MPTPQQIAAELADPESPLAAQYAGPLASGDDAGIASLLTAPSEGRSYQQQPVQRRHIKNVLIACNCLGTLYAGTGPWAKTAQTLFTDPDFPTVDTSDDVWLALIGGLVAEGAVTAEAAEMVAALSAVSPASRAQELWGESARVTGEDVAAARRVM